MKKILMSLAFFALVLAPMTMSAENAVGAEKAKTTCCKKDGEMKGCCKKDGEKKACCKKDGEKKACCKKGEEKK